VFSLAAISYSCFSFLCPRRTVLLPSPWKSPEQDNCRLINPLKPSVIYQVFCLRPCCRTHTSFCTSISHSLHPDLASIKDKFCLKITSSECSWIPTSEFLTEYGSTCGFRALDQNHCSHLT